MDGHATFYKIIAERDMFQLFREARLVSLTNCGYEVGMNQAWKAFVGCLRPDVGVGLDGPVVV